jgi:hypothetical protein
MSVNRTLCYIYYHLTETRNQTAPVCRGIAHPVFCQDQLEGNISKNLKIFAEAIE